MAKRKRPYRPAKERKSRRRADAGAAVSGAAHRPSAGAPYWIYGTHAALAVLANPARACHRILATAAPGSPLEAEIGRIRDSAPGLPALEKVDQAEIDRALGHDAVHQGLAVLADPLPALAIEDAIATAGAEGAAVVVLDQVTDPRNVGAVLRSAAAFGVAAVIVQDRHAPPMTGALCKAASGAAERVPMVRAVNLARAIWALKDAGFWITGLDPDADLSLSSAGLSGRAGLVIGTEGRGLRRLIRETCDQLVRVPIAADVDSLNLSNAAAVALYELRRTSS